MLLEHDYKHAFFYKKLKSHVVLAVKVIDLCGHISLSFIPLFYFYFYNPRFSISVSFSIHIFFFGHLVRGIYCWSAGSLFLNPHFNGYQVPSEEE